MTHDHSCGTLLPRRTLISESMTSISAFTQLERSILYLVLMDASASVVKIAATLGCKPHSVQAAINKFRRNGLISRRIMVDVYRLGYSRHAFYISLSSEGQRQRDKLVLSLVNHPSTTVVLEVGGEYDFFVAVITRNPGELAAFQSTLADTFGVPFQKKDLALTIRHSVFGEKSLLADLSACTECTYAVTDSLVETDALDRRILAELCAPGVISFPHVARKLGLPQSTLDYRLKRLKEQQVICGDMHEIKGELIGLSNYIVLLGMTGLNQATQSRFYSFVKHHPYVAHYSHEVGHWDYMLGIAVDSHQRVNELVEQMRRLFGESIATVKSFPMFRARKVVDYSLQLGTSGSSVVGGMVGNG
jgi:DNA-binding Lrp family transcriptional regulator